MRYIFIAFCLFSCLSLRAAFDAKSFFSDDLFFLNPTDVLKAYEGSWIGEEDLFLRGTLLGNIKLENRNKFASGVVLSSKGTARMASNVMNIEASMLILAGDIYLHSKDENARDIVYKGYIKNNSVEWYRTEKFFAYEYTRDVFSEEGNVMKIQTYSVKPYLSKGKLLYLEYKGELSKYINPKLKQKINPDKLDISKLRF